MSAGRLYVRIRIGYRTRLPDCCRTSGQPGPGFGFTHSASVSRIRPPSDGTSRNLGVFFMKTPRSPSESGRVCPIPSILRCPDTPTAAGTRSKSPGLPAALFVCLLPVLLCLQRTGSRIIYPKDCVGASAVSRWPAGVPNPGRERAVRARSRARLRSFHQENFEVSQWYPDAVCREALRMTGEATTGRGYMILLMGASDKCSEKVYFTRHF